LPVGGAKTKSDINFIITIIGEKIIKKSPYILVLKKNLDMQMKFFFSFQIGFVSLISLFLSIWIVQLYKSVIIKPLVEITRFMNKENNQTDMIKFLQEMKKKEQKEKNLQQLEKQAEVKRHQQAENIKKALSFSTKHIRIKVEKQKEEE